MTRDAAAIANCKAVGNVASIPPYVLPGEHLMQMKIKLWTLVGISF